MKCIACNRPLLRYAASTQTRAGLIGWGPKCAAKAGAIVAPTRTLQPVPMRRPMARPVVDEAQPGLFDHFPDAGQMVPELSPRASQHP